VRERLDGSAPATARERVAARRARLRARNERSQQPGAHHFSSALGILSLAVLIVILVVGGSTLLFRQVYTSRIMPGVSVQGHLLEGLSVAEARALLEQRFGALTTAPVTFVLNGRSWRPTAAEIGIQVEFDSAVAEAYRVGRDTRLGDQLRRLSTAQESRIDLPIRITLDERRLHAYLGEIAGTVEIAPQSANLVASQGRVLSTPARSGQQVLIDDTARDVIAALPRLEPYTATLQVRTLAPTMTDAAVAPARERLAVLLNGPIELRTDQHSWQWTPQEIGSLIRLAPVATEDGSLRLEATIDRASLAARIGDLAPVVEQPPIEPRVRFSHQGVQIETPGRAGVMLDTELAVAEVEAALWQGRQTIELPLSTVQPLVSEAMLERLGIVELVAQGKSDFAGSAPYRVTNIIAGAERMNGVLIPPDGEFSFNQTVGAIDESNGFTRGYAIIDGRTQLEWGGGVCQVSTTVFRAAFWAGVPITERNQHSFRIRWYEVYEPLGMDAAIFTGPGGYDLRFVNDTGRWLLLQTDVDTAQSLLTVSLYGTRPNREVIQVPPEISRNVPPPSAPRYFDDSSLPAGTLKQTDTARGGMDVRVGRIVRQDGREVRSDVFFSRFQPWPDIFVRGTGA
jgi:vancomycin resistance protein YoaR